MRPRHLTVVMCACLIAGHGGHNLGRPALVTDRAIEACLRALAVDSATRSEGLPDVTTIGGFLPGYEVTTWFGIGAPSKTPVEIIDKLNNEIARQARPALPQLVRCGL